MKPANAASQEREEAWIGDAVLALFARRWILTNVRCMDAELFTAMEDLRSARCDILTLGQYLQPTLKHLPVVEFVHPDKFAAYKARAESLGFAHVASGPMVRSSYHADEFSMPLRPVS